MKHGQAQPQGSLIANRDQQREEQTHHQSGPVHQVGKNSHPQVGNRQNDDQAGEKQPFNRCLRNPKFQIRQHKQQPGGQLHDRIHRRNRMLARPALARQPQPPEHRHVVIRLDGVPAIGAPRRRRHNGQAFRYPRNADIQKAPNNDPKQEKEADDHHSTLTQDPCSLNYRAVRPCSMLHSLFGDNAIPGCSLSGHVVSLSSRATRGICFFS